MIGDCANAVFRSDWRTLIGLPIGTLMIYYLMRASTRLWFAQRNALVATPAFD